MKTTTTMMMMMAMMATNKRRHHHHHHHRRPRSNNVVVVAAVPLSSRLVRRDAVTARFHNNPRYPRDPVVVEAFVHNNPLSHQGQPVLVNPRHLRHGAAAHRHNGLRDLDHRKVGVSCRKHHLVPVCPSVRVDGVIIPVVAAMTVGVSIRTSRTAEATSRKLRAHTVVIMIMMMD